MSDRACKLFVFTNCISGLYLRQASESRCRKGRVILPEPLLAFWLELDAHRTCEIARLAGYDAAIFDMEHGTIAETSLDRLVPF